MHLTHDAKAGGYGGGHHPLSVWFEHLKNLEMEAQPVNIMQEGRQSRPLVQIRNLLQNGVRISHILNVKLSNEPLDNAHKSALRRALKQRLWNNPHIFTVNNEGNELPGVSITWQMENARATTAYYYAISVPYIDSIVAEHTRIMLSSICRDIREAHPEYGQEWGLAHLVSTPLMTFRPIVPVFVEGTIGIGNVPDYEHEYEDENDIE